MRLIKDYIRIILLFVLAIYGNVFSQAQSFRDEYQQFNKRVTANYSDFRNECNRKYVEFLRQAWSWYEGNAPLPLPKEENPVPPRPYKDDEQEEPHIEIIPVNVEPEEDEIPQPKPVEPIREVPTPQDDSFSIDFYGVTCNVRMPESSRLKLPECSNKSIADAWQRLSSDDMNNAIRDCLETRIRYNLCDWAYLLFLDELCRKFCPDANGATLIMAYIYCQSGYQMRLAKSGARLFMLYGSRHQIYDISYYKIDGKMFYPFGKTSGGGIEICDAGFAGETPMSLLINSEQVFGGHMSELRDIQSRRYTDMTISSQVPESAISFFDRYPSSAIDGNPLTKWMMYANTPLAEKTKETIYPSLKQSIDGCQEELAVNKLLNWVQTGFEYEYDDKVWGYDRAFFAEETLYYPYCDCEDRSILFSRLVRDLVGLDVALVYYPGHLATAVAFNDDVKGDAMNINGRRYIICDPTYIGAPVGKQMPDLDVSNARAITLKQ